MSDPWNDRSGPVEWRYRDVEYGQTVCEHMDGNAERGALHWEKLRGKTVTIDLDTFVAGSCWNCDSWLVLPRQQQNGWWVCVWRGSGGPAKSVKSGTVH